MTRVVLSIGSNLGDRMAHLRSVVDALGDRVVAVSPVYQTAPWGGVDQDPFLNAVVIAEDPTLDGPGWLEFAQERERAADRVREQRWGPRTLDVDLVAVRDPERPQVDVTSATDVLTLPHPLAHVRAFVLIPWLAVEPDATLTVDGQRRSIESLLCDIDAAERDGVELFPARLHGPDQEA